MQNIYYTILYYTAIVIGGGYFRPASNAAIGRKEKELDSRVIYFR